MLFRSDAEISEGTETIGNVKIVDASGTTNASVETDGTKNAIYVRSNSLATTALQNEQQAKLTNINSKLATINTSLSEINVSNKRSCKKDLCFSASN